MLRLRTKESLMLNTIGSQARKNQEKSVRHVRGRCRTSRTSCTRGSVDDRKDRTVRAGDPSEPHVTCSRVCSGVRGQTSLHILPVPPDGESQDSHAERKLSSDTRIIQSNIINSYRKWTRLGLQGLLLCTFIHNYTYYTSLIYNYTNLITQ